MIGFGKFVNCWKLTCDCVRKEGLMNVLVFEVHRYAEKPEELHFMCPSCKSTAIYDTDEKKITEAYKFEDGIRVKVEVTEEKPAKDENTLPECPFCQEHTLTPYDAVDEPYNLICEICKKKFIMKENNKNEITFSVSSRR